MEEYQVIHSLFIYLFIFSLEQCPREILFIVDSSGSVQRIYDQQKEYLLSLINELQVTVLHETYHSWEAMLAEYMLNIPFNLLIMRNDQMNCTEYISNSF